MPCLDENALQGFAQGTLGAEELAQAHAHLDGCAQCRRVAALLASATAESARAAARSASVAEPGGALEPSQARGSFGRYFVIEPLGRGGMGEVLLAYDPKLDRNVALKRLRSREADLPISARARLLREAQAMARLSHPNVLTVHDAGELEGEVFISMEYVRGHTLRQWLDEPRDWRETLAVFRAAGEGLAAAHRAGLIHRDFKPDNVLVGEDGRVRVTDFGLARAQALPEASPEARPGGALPGAGSSDGPGAPSTQTGALLGTAGYIAPEALRSELGPLSDQFSFFVSLYEGLYGVRPFEGRTPQAQLQAAQRNELRPAPSERGVPKRLRRLLLVGLAADPNRRFASMEGALTALSRVPLHPVRRWAAGSAAAAGVAALAAIALWARGEPERQCAGAERFLAGTWDEAKRQSMRASFAATGAPQSEIAFQSAARTLDQWAQAWAKARTEACRATRVFAEQPAAVMDLKMRCLDRRWMDFDALVRQLSAGGAALVPNAVKAAEGLPDLFECANPAALGGQAIPEDEAKRKRLEELRHKLAEARADHLVKAAEPGLLLAKEIERDAGTLQLESARIEALVLLGMLHDDAGDYSTAETNLFQAVTQAMALGQDALVAEASVELVRVLGPRLQRFAEAHRWEQLARASVTRSGLIGREQEARLLSHVAIIAAYERSHEASRRALREALSIRERLYGPEHVLVGATLYNLAIVSLNAHLPGEASGYIKRALAIYERLLGTEHRDVANALDVMGGIARKEGHLDEACAIAERVVALGARALPSDHPFQANFLHNLGEARLDHGDFRGAKEAFDSALAIRRKSLGEHHPNLGETLHMLAVLEVLSGDTRSGIEHGEYVARTFPSMTAEALGNVAEAYRKLGKVDLARQRLENALAVLSKEPPDERVEVPLLTGLAECELARGLRNDALARLERAMALGDGAHLPPQNLASTRFALARALPAAESERARTLAAEAQRWFAASRRTAKVREADRFLAGLHTAQK